MVITLHMQWWTAPLVITVLALLWAFLWPADNTGLFGGTVRLFMLLPALVLSISGWMIGGILK
jgi:hypothetical protein